MTFTPEELADVEAIRMLSARYARGLDRSKLAEILACFTDDAVFDISPKGGPTLRGSAELEAFYVHDLATIAEQMHSYSNFIIELDGATEAHGTNYLWAEARTNDGAHIRTTSFNEDVYAKRGGRWLIARRVVRPLVVLDETSGSVLQRAVGAWNRPPS
jgi:ketosteroid isomerase-like protein